MLELPTEGLTELNAETEAIADWLEASVLFFEPEFSSPEIVDIMLEDPRFCDDQDRAHGVSEAALDLVGSRHRITSGHDSYPLEVSSRRIRRCVDTWEVVPAHSLFVLLSLRLWYDIPALHDGFAQAAVYFEAIAAASLRTQFPNWSIRQVGWGPGNTSGFRNVLDEVCRDLHCSHTQNVGELLRSKDGGLDILMSRPFADGRRSVVSYFIQCAAGKNWQDKRNTPNLAFWDSILVDKTSPQAGFAVPFALADSEFNFTSRSVPGPLFDRLRLLSADRDTRTWLDPAVGQDVIEWIRPRIAHIGALAI